MIIDAQHLLASSQVIAATGPSTNVIDLGSDRNIGIGRSLAIVLIVLAIDAVTGDETYSVQIQADDNVGFATPGNVGGLVAIPRTSPVGTKVVLPLPPDISTERFLRLQLTLAGTTPSLTFTAFLTDREFIGTENVYYPDAINIA